MQELYVNVTEKAPRPLSSDVAARIVSDRSAWPVHRPSVEDILGSIRVRRRYQVPFQDAVILVSASQLGSAVLWSEDLNPGPASDQVRVAGPI